MATVDVITVNYRNAQGVATLAAGLRGAAALLGPVRLVVVDCSGDLGPPPSVAGVAVDVIDPGENIGFGRACNLGLAHAHGDIVVFVNPDVELDPVAFARLVRAGVDSSAVAWTGVLRNLDGSVQRNTAPPPAMWREALEYLLGVDTRLRPPQAEREVGTITGALLCARAGAVKALGGFDERYPLYVEDVDICRRMRERGPLLQFPLEVGTHAGGVSAATAPTRTTTLLHASRVLYWREQGWLRGLAARWMVVAGCSLRKAIRRHDAIEIRAVIRASSPDASLPDVLPPRSGGAGHVLRQVTAVVLTHNSEVSLERTLTSLAPLSVLVVDGGSDDATRTIARDRGATVLERRFRSFADQRNWAMAQATTPYVLMVDSDEAATPELLEDVARAVQRGVDGAWIPTLDWFAGRWLVHGNAYPQPHLRLLRREAARYVGDVHERVEFTVEHPVVMQLEPPLLHRSHVTFSHYLQKLDRYTEIEAQGMAGRSPALLLARGVGEGAAVVARGLIVRSGWRDGVHGIVVAFAYGIYRFVVYAKAALAAAPRQSDDSNEAMRRWRLR